MVVTTAYAIYTLLASLFLTSETLGLTRRIPHNSITDVILAVCVAVFEGVRPQVILPAQEPLVSCEERPLVLPTSVDCSCGCCTADASTEAADGGVCKGS